MSAEASSWYIKAKDRRYGPFGLERLRAFAAEGRLNARSMVCHDAEGEFIPAQSDPVLGPLLQKPQNPDSAQPSARTRRRFVVFVSAKGPSRSAFIEQLSRFGVAIETLDGIWLLNAPTEAHTLRNALSQVLGRDDTLFVADATQGTSAWFNLGQEMDDRIRRFWQTSA